MTFTDEKLKLWKEWIKGGRIMDIQREELEALVNRLEAAEKVITFPAHECIPPDDVGDDDNCLFCSLRRTWLKACGK